MDASPYDPETIRAGAVVTFHGARLATSGAAIADSIAASRVSDGDQPLAVPGVVVLRRGRASIVPLSWEPAGIEGDAHEQMTLRRRATELWTEVSGTLQHRFGPAIGIDLGADAALSYAIGLRRSGARRADRWIVDDTAIVLVVYGAPVPAPKTATAVHVVPRTWLSHARTSTATDTDLAWTWVDAVNTAAAAHHAART